LVHNSHLEEPAMAVHGNYKFHPPSLVPTPEP
jgi:hypothetical protein